LRKVWIFKGGINESMVYGEMKFGSFVFCFE
jgi:hypothetical protein